MIAPFTNRRVISGARSRVFAQGEGRAGLLPQPVASAFLRLGPSSGRYGVYRASPWMKQSMTASHSDLVG